MAGRKLVYGVGINNADYKVTISEMVDGKAKNIWRCPYYVSWTSLLMRCYSEVYQLKRPTYVGCSTVPEWHYFMNYRKWMQTQDWSGKELDKDILFPGNKIYGPDKCVFVDIKVNSFFLDCGASRGQWPIGTSYCKYNKKFIAYCMSVETGKLKNLGYYSTPEEAHSKWLAYKKEQAKILASYQKDERVAQALINRYQND